MFGSSVRQTTSRNAIQGKGSSVLQTRSANRNEFIHRIRNVRLKELDKFRRISVEELDLDSLLKIRQVLLIDKDNSDLVAPQDVDDILKVVQDEIVAIQAEEREKEEMESTEKLAELLLTNKCIICEGIIQEGNMCDNCLKIDFSAPI